MHKAFEGVFTLMALLLWQVLNKLVLGEQGDVHFEAVVLGLINRDELGQKREQLLLLFEVVLPLVVVLSQKPLLLDKGVDM